MELALTALPAHSHSMLYEYGLLSERNKAVQEESPLLQDNDFTAALVWMDGGRAAKQSGAFRLICAGCGHACNLSQSEGVP